MAISNSAVSCAGCLLAIRFASNAFAINLAESNKLNVDNDNENNYHLD